MSLWEDPGFTTAYNSREMKAKQLLFAKVDLESFGIEQKFQARPLRCWQTLTSDGSGEQYKIIVSNG